MLNKIIAKDVEQISEDIKEEASALEGKTLLVTGGSGFLCSYFLDVAAFFNENYFKRPCQLICLDNLISGSKSRISHLLPKSYFRFINHDVSEPFSFDGQINFIIHGASIASPLIYRTHALETIKANSFGTYYMLELARKKKTESFLYMSSSETYGDPSPENIPTPETYRGNVSYTGPRACYDESKRLAETLSMTFFRKYNLPVKIARPFNVYGPGLRLEDKRAVPDFIDNALHNRSIVMYSDGTDTRDFCYVSDAIRGLFKVLLSNFNGEVFNIGNDFGETSIGELAQMIRELFGNKIGVVHKASKDPNYLKDNPRRRCPDLTKIRKYLNYEPKIDLKTGLQRSIAWYKEAYNLEGSA